MLRPPAGQAPEYDVPDLLPARMVNEFVYCPRLFHLEWVGKEWADSHDTVAGAGTHRRVDRPASDLPSPDAPGDVERTGRVTSLDLASEEEGLTAKLDLVEVEGDQFVPVDYKKGNAPNSGRPWDADRLQVGVQALLLRSAGYRCDEAVVYYAGSKRRLSVVVDDALIEEVRSVARAARVAAAAVVPPPPLVDSPKCVGCSLAGICLPDETKLLADLEPDTDVEPDGETSAQAKSAPRILVPASAALPAYITSQGARVGKRGEQIVVEYRDNTQATVRLLDVSQLCIFGGVMVSAQLVGELMSRDIPICHFTIGGWFHGVTHSIGSRNVAVRIAQFATAANPVACLELARGIVSRKIKNQRTMLRRNHEAAPDRTLRELDDLSQRALKAESAESLLGLEGLAAKTYFREFPGMLRPDVRSGAAFDLEGRNRRPPRDRVNALLSFAYSILSKDWTVTLFSVGLDPFVGVFHRPRFGRPSLALDLMEEFRPIVADSVVLQLINNGEVKPNSFIERAGSFALTAEGRKSFFQAWERRLSQEIQHPIFRYRVDYRRLFEVQARLFARQLTGEIESYPGFTTR